MRTARSSKRKKRRKGDASCKRARLSSYFSPLGIGLARLGNGGFFTRLVGYFLSPSLEELSVHFSFTRSPSTPQPRDTPRILRRKAFRADFSFSATP